MQKQQLKEFAAQTRAMLKKNNSQRMFSAPSDEERANQVDEFARIILLETFLDQPDIKSLPEDTDIKAVDFCEFLYQRGTGNLKLDAQWLESDSKSAVFFREFLGTTDLDKLHEDTLKSMASSIPTPDAAQGKWCSIS